MCLTLQLSLSSRPSSPNVGVWLWVSEGTQRRTFPSSPAVASISPRQPLMALKQDAIASSKRTFWSESNDIDGLRMLRGPLAHGVVNCKHAWVSDLDQGCQVCHFPVFSLHLNSPQPDIIVPSTRSESTLSMRLEVGRVDGRIVVMPGDEQR